MSIGSRVDDRGKDPGGQLRQWPIRMTARSRTPSTRGAGEASNERTCIDEAFAAEAGKVAPVRYCYSPRLVASNAAGPPSVGYIPRSVTAEEENHSVALVPICLGRPQADGPRPPRRSFRTRPHEPGSPEGRRTDSDLRGAASLTWSAFPPGRKTRSAN